jgi:hypothetical protein
LVIAVCWRARSVLLLALIFALGACQQLGLPEQGFATQKFGSFGNILRRNFDPSSDFEDPISGHALGSEATNRNSGVGSCAWIAQQRAQDVEAQGLDEDTQKKTYAFVLKDCQAWAVRRGVH